MGRGEGVLGGVGGGGVGVGRGEGVHWWDGREL